MESAGTPIGVAGIKHIDNIAKSGEFFLYIGDKNYWGKGIGGYILSNLKERAHRQNISKLYATIRKDNVRSMKSHLKNGYVPWRETDETCTLIWQRNQL